MSGRYCIVWANDEGEPEIVESGLLFAGALALARAWNSKSRQPRYRVESDQGGKTTAQIPEENG